MAERRREVCRYCGSVRTVSNGSSRGHHQWRWHDCGRSFRSTTGTAVAHLRTPADDVARALLVVMRRRSLRAAEEITGHKYETIGAWPQRAGRHTAAVMAVLVHYLQLSELEVDEFWSFVRKKGSLRPAP